MPQSVQLVFGPVFEPGTARMEASVLAIRQRRSYFQETICT